MKIGIIAAALAFVGLSAVAQTNQKTNMDMKKLELVQEWDKTFPKSDKVEHSKVVFVNRFGVTLAADMYVPKEVVGSIFVSSPQRIRLILPRRISCIEEAIWKGTGSRSAMVFW